MTWPKVLIWITATVSQVHDQKTFQMSTQIKTQNKITVIKLAVGFVKVIIFNSYNENHFVIMA